MNTSAAKKLEIVKELSNIPENKLDQVKTYIKSLLPESKATVKKNRSLKGIWKDKGFERITDLEAELEEVRRHMNESILKRKI